MSVIQPSPLSRIGFGATPWNQTGVFRARPFLSIGLLATADVFAILLAAITSTGLWIYLGRPFEVSLYQRLWPMIFLFPAAYAAFGLYPAFGCNPADVLRKLSSSTSIVFAVMAVAVFLLKEAASYSRGVFVLAWVQALVFVPLFRAAVRMKSSRYSWWGYPVVLIGHEEKCTPLIEKLQQSPELGLRPLAWFQQPAEAAGIAHKKLAKHAIVSISNLPRNSASDVLRACNDLFPDVILLPELGEFSSLWVESRDLNGALGLAVRQRLLLREARIVKRALDLVLLAVLSVVAAPILGLIAILTKLDSSGPILYRQRRLGRNGEAFTAWKFRTMVSNADETLNRHLARDPALTAEWQQTRKLKDDPRVTRLGRFLRRSSLDELPQLWNVLRGQMSMVGPRPIVADEIWRYGDDYSLYTKVVPGLTGLWQVSGRNRLSYHQRVELDLYYVRNWSPWLDLYLLTRTVVAVLRGDGAY